MSDADAGSHPARDDGAAAQLVPWRETCREVIYLVAYETGDEADAHYEILQELFEEQWSDLVAKINALQGSIKAVTVFSRGKTHTYHESGVYGDAGYGYGYGWGIEIPDFVEVIYEVCDYIPANEYRERKAQAIKELERQGGFSSAGEQLRQRYKSASDELEQLESSLAHEQAELNDIETGVRERPGILLSKWSFRGVEYESRDKADDARDQLVRVHYPKVERLRTLRDKKQREVERLRRAADSLGKYSGQIE